MRLIRYLCDVPRTDSARVVAIGNFDGIHRGHQALITSARQQADALGLTLTVLSFHPHPVDVFDQDGPDRRLSTFRQKYQRLRALRVDELVLLPFNAQLIGMTAQAFMESILDQGLRAKVILVGDNFRFGHKRQGSVDTLSDYGRAHDITILPQSLSSSDSEAVYSSTAVREALADGRVDLARDILGRFYGYQGRVVRGDQRGRQLGYPTANVAAAAAHRLLRPAPGVYAVRLGVEDTNNRTIWHDGVASLGYRPTFDGHDFRTEVHLIDFTGTHYGKRVEVAFVAHLRGELKFDTVDALIAQMDRDSDDAKDILRRSPLTI